MRREVHPISGVVYEEVGKGIVRVESDKGAFGLFRYDGAWLEGDITHADLHFLHYVGGPELPPGRDIYWAMAPVVPEDGTESRAVERAPGEIMEHQPKIVAKYQRDPGLATPAGMRSTGYKELEYFLEHDRYPERIPDVYRLTSPLGGGPLQVNTECFYTKAFHDLEVERLWKRTWQMACREEDIPDVGDYHVYEIAHLSFLIVRTGETEISAYTNACLHRGRLLKTSAGHKATEFRCPFHGWTWNIDGSLKEITTEWDFPGVRECVSHLPHAKVGVWGGFVFINPDPDCIPLEEFLGPVMIGHYRKFKLENRYKQAHVQRVIRANWKTTMEAFMEGYHIIATHPQLMLTSGDGANIPYDVFGNWGRAGHVGFTFPGSPQRGIIPSREEALAGYRAGADFLRGYLRTLIGDEVDAFSDAEINDGSFNDVFPNFHPWGGFSRLVFRFRPNGGNPDECLMDVMLLAPWPEGKPKPAPAALRILGPDQSWTEAPELVSLARIFDQDILNLPSVQAGMKTKQPPYVWFSAYQESKIRNFHQNYDRALGLGDAAEAQPPADARPAAAAE